MTTNYLSINSLKVSKELSSFVDNELLTDTGVAPKKFWAEFDKAAHELTPKNKELLEEEIFTTIISILKQQIFFSFFCFWRCR